jgi:hypothetical protein
MRLAAAPLLSASLKGVKMDKTRAINELLACYEVSDAIDIPDLCERVWEAAVAHVRPQIEAEARAAEKEACKWIPVSEHPPKPGFPVLVTDGKKVLRAAHAPKFTLDCDNWGHFEPDGGEHDEATDMTYWPEGWYEWNHHEEIHWALDNDPTHWMPLPNQPKS